MNNPSREKTHTSTQLRVPDSTVIWNENKILRILVPILTYLRIKSYGLYCMLRKNFCVKIGQNGYQNAQNFILIPNLKTKLRKSAQVKIYLEKN